MIKGSIHQEDMIIISIYVPTIRAPKGMMPTLTELKGGVALGYHACAVQQGGQPPSRSPHPSMWAPVSLGAPCCLLAFESLCCP